MENKPKPRRGRPRGVITPKHSYHYQIPIPILGIIDEIADNNRLTYVDVLNNSVKHYYEYLKNNKDEKGV